jgi:hypothetical protein
MALIDSIGKASAAGASNVTNALNQIGAVAKGALCLPSIITGLPSTLGAIAGGIAAAATSAAASILETATIIVSNAIAAQIAKITGAIDSLINTVTSLIATVGAVIEIAKTTAASIYNRTNEITDFLLNKENCNFAAAVLANCMVSQALGTVTGKLTVDLGKGLTKIDDIGDRVASAISSPAGAVDNFMNKASGKFDRAASVTSAAKLF